MIRAVSDSRPVMVLSTTVGNTSAIDNLYTYFGEHRSLRVVAPRIGHMFHGPYSTKLRELQEIRSTMSDALRPATSGMKAVALLIAWISLVQLDPRAPFNLPETAYNATVMATAAVGILAAIGIWLNWTWMMFAYSAWLVLMVIARIWHDAQLEPVTWKVALGGVIVTAFLGLVGLFLHRDQRQSRV